MLESVSKRAQEEVDRYDADGHAREISLSVRNAVAGVAVAEAGAVGLGALIVAAASTAAVDVTGILTRAAVSRVHVLLVDVPGELRLRWAAEEEITQRGWVLAGSVADADVLLVCGEPGTGLSAVVDDVWTRFSRPRVRAQVLQPHEVAAVLEEAARGLVRDIGNDVTRALSGTVQP